MTIPAGQASTAITIEPLPDNVVEALETVILSRSGTASNGSDYVHIGGPNFALTIPANQTSATVTLTPIDDGAVEDAETVVLTINPSTRYIIGPPGTATVTIADNE